MAAATSGNDRSFYHMKDVRLGCARLEACYDADGARFSPPMHIRLPVVERELGELRRARFRGREGESRGGKRGRCTDVGAEERAPGTDRILEDPRKARSLYGPRRGGRAEETDHWFVYTLSMYIEVYTAADM